MSYPTSPVPSARLYAAGGYALLALLMLALGCAPASTLADEPTAPEAAPTAERLPANPAPTLAPAAVVEAQVEALRASDTPADPGAGTAFAFLAPVLQYQLGQEAGWKAVLASGPYGPLLDAESVAFGAMRQRSDRAMQRVVLQLAGGGEAAYIFRLRRTNLDYPASCRRGCWVTAQIIQEYDTAERSRAETSPDIAGG